MTFCLGKACFPARSRSCVSSLNPPCLSASLLSCSSWNWVWFHLYSYGAKCNRNPSVPRNRSLAFARGCCVGLVWGTLLQLTARNPPALYSHLSAMKSICIPRLLILWKRVILAPPCLLSVAYFYFSLWAIAFLTRFCFSSLVCLQCLLLNRWVDLIFSSLGHVVGGKRQQEIMI